MDVTIHGIRLHVTDDGAGQAVLLIHGFPLHGAMWRPQIAALTAASTSSQYRVIVPDLRGFGASEAPAGPYLMETFADDIAALLDLLQIERAVIGGLSMGGYIAFAFLRRYAERVQGLILADTRPTADNADTRSGRETNAQLVEREGVSVLAANMESVLVAPTASAELRTALRTMMIQNTPWGVAGALRGMALRPDAMDLLSTIRVPTLILVGAEDNITPYEIARVMHTHIPQSRLVVISGAGHMANLEQPEAFNTALLQFLHEIS